MNETIPLNPEDPNYKEAQKRVRKIKNFYKNLYSWIGTSIFLVALDLFLSGGITWSKYPVFFWGITLIIDLFKVIHIYRTNKEWEEGMIRKFAGKDAVPAPLPDKRSVDDYSGDLLNNEPVAEKELADLSEYRKLKRPWKDEDLV